MINNQSDKPEKLKPQDSKEKEIKYPKDDNEAVIKPEDKTYNRGNANFKNVAKKKELSEQPANSVKG